MLLLWFMSGFYFLNFNWLYWGAFTITILVVISLLLTIHFNVYVEKMDQHQRFVGFLKITEDTRKILGDRSHTQELKEEKKSHFSLKKFLFKDFEEEGLEGGILS
mmetsp:Transcript_41304/g.39774  ORF Transcript_41304/g.39774 Transcript_41304/m.39774 type:complete len:105 (-) Transcript_41304:42-356(-)